MSVLLTVIVASLTLALLLEARFPLRSVAEAPLRRWFTNLSLSALSLATSLARIFHRSRATNEYGIALVCPKIQVSNLDQRAGNAEAKLYRRN